MATTTTTAAAAAAAAEPAHRFADVGKVSRGQLDESVWNLSIIAVSNACEQLVHQVSDKTQSLRDALLKLQNLVIVSDNSLKTNVFLRATTELLLLHGRSPEIHASMNFVLSQPAVPDLVHPYVTILRQRPELFDAISLQLDLLLDAEYDNPKYLTETMRSFYSYVLLSSDAMRRACLLQQFSNVFRDQLRTEIHLYLVHTICRYPVKRNDGFYLHLVDYAVTFLKHTKLQEDDLKHTASLLFYHLLNRAADAATSGESISATMHRLQRIYHLRLDGGQAAMTQVDLYLLWTTLSYLLATAQTVDDQDILLNVMHEAVNRHPDAKGPVLFVAMLPLFQTWSETIEPSGRRKTSVLDLISCVGKYGNEPSDVKGCLENMQTIFDSFHITGSLANVASSLHRCILGNDINQPIPSHTSSYVLALLFNTPLALSNDVDVRHKHLSRLAKIAFSPCSTTHSFRFAVFLLLLFLMRSHDKMSSQSLIFIFHNILPSLVDPNDPIVTSKILQLILPMIRGSRDTVMSSIAFKVLVKLYERQPRIWQELKKVLATWTIHRKSMTNVNKEGAIRMEFAVLSSMRDLCKSRPRECAQDILPMLISVLQTCTNISNASITLIVQAISACIRAGLAEPRSIWTVALSYIAEYASQYDADQVALLWKSLCEFFEIVGDKDEVSEPYIEFKETILHTYIEPLLAAENETIRTAALKALSHFPAVDILQLLPEKSKQYTQEICEAPNKHHTLVLARLLSHELDHMRRGLFQEEVKKDGKDRGTTRKVLYDREYQLAGMYIANLEQAKAAPGLRTGYAIAALFSAQQHLSDHHATTENLTKSKWYRCMATSIADIGLTDNLLVRVSCLNGWMTLFKTALASDENALDTKTHLLLKDLNTRLNKSTVPGSTSNILLAITGLILTVNKLNPALGATCASEVLDVFERYLADSSSSLSSTLLLSEEVQFAANFAFGHVASCIVSNEKMATRVLDKIVDNVTSNMKGRPLDTTIDIVQFARGYAAGHFTAALATWPTQTPAIQVLSESGIERLLAYCNSPGGNISESRALGIMMGWASTVKPAEMKSVLSFAQSVLKTYIEGNASLNKGILLGSFWVCSYAAVTEDGLLEEAANVLESAATLTESDPEMTAHSYLYSVPFARLNRYRMVSSVRDTEATPGFSNLLLHETNTIEHGDTAQKISAMLTLGSLLGADYLTTDIEQAESQIYKYHAETRLGFLNHLASLANLEGVSSIGNLKNSRIAAVVLGNIIGVAMMLREAASSGAANAGPALTSSSTEPKNYSRLNNNSSFLRAVFDTMVEIAPMRQHVAALKIFLTSLRDTPGPLPPVNWFNILMDISRISNDLQSLSIQFASRHASTSMSLSEFIIAQLDFKNVSDTGVRITAVGDAGVGKILELCGFVNHKTQKAGYKRRGMDAVTTKVTISGMRCLEIFGSLITSLKTVSPKIQLEFLSTLNDYLPPPKQSTGDETQDDVLQHLRDMVYYNITVPQLRNLTDIDVLRNAVDCSLVKNEQLSTDSTFANAVVIAEMYRLGRSAAPTWITDTIRNAAANIVDDQGTWNELAFAILASDCQDDRQKLQWVIRLLDILIVIGSDKSTGDCKTLFANATQNGLRLILSMLWWGQAEGQDFLRVPETEYMLSFALEVGNHYPTEQQQMMKRILTLMSRETALQPLFSNVLHNAPEKVLASQGDELAVLLSGQ